jgi:hypothetical protein
MWRLVRSIAGIGGRIEACLGTPNVRNLASGFPEIGWQGTNCPGLSSAEDRTNNRDRWKHQIQLHALFLFLSFFLFLSILVVECWLQDGRK